MSNVIEVKFRDDDYEEFCDHCGAGVASSEHVSRCIRRWTCPDCRTTIGREDIDGCRVSEWELEFLHRADCRDQP